MTKLLRIEGCIQCDHKRHTVGLPPRCAHPTVVELGKDEWTAAWQAIPHWCPLEDATSVEIAQEIRHISSELFALDVPKEQIFTLLRLRLRLSEIAEEIAPGSRADLAAYALPMTEIDKTARIAELEVLHAQLVKDSFWHNMPSLEDLRAAEVILKREEDGDDSDTDAG